MSCIETSNFRKAPINVTFQGHTMYFNKCPKKENHPTPPIKPTEHSDLNVAQQHSV